MDTCDCPNSCSYKTLSMRLLLRLLWILFQIVLYTSSCIVRFILLSPFKMGRTIYCFLSNFGKIPEVRTPEELWIEKYKILFAKTHVLKLELQRIERDRVQRHERVQMFRRWYPHLYKEFNRKMQVRHNNQTFKSQYWDEDVSLVDLECRIKFVDDEKCTW